MVQEASALVASVVWEALACLGCWAKAHGDLMGKYSHHKHELQSTWTLRLTLLFPASFTPFDPVSAAAPPGITAKGPKGYCFINLITLSGSSRSQKAQFLSILSGGTPEFEFETHAYPVTDNVIEFLTKIGGNKDQWRATEIREQGDGTWQRGISVKFKREGQWYTRLEGLGWGKKRGGHQARPVWVVLWKKPEE